MEKEGSKRRKRRMEGRGETGLSDDAEADGNRDHSASMAGTAEANAPEVSGQTHSQPSWQSASTSHDSAAADTMPAHRRDHPLVARTIFFSRRKNGLKCCAESARKTQSAPCWHRTHD
jgi:hypothetical protein